MNVLASTAMGMDIIDQTLFVTGMTLAVFGLVICIGLVVYDLRRFYRERSQGKQSIWYKRPTILLCEGLLLTNISGVLNELRLGKIIPATLLSYIFVFTLLIIAIMILIYGLVLSIRNRRLSRL